MIASLRLSKARIAMLAGLTLGAVATVAVAAPAKNWTANVLRSAIGSHVMGNPAAKVKVIEYLSFTCPHCAHFASDSAVPLKKNYVSTGKVSVEFRNAVRDQFDMTAALAARCGAPANFFRNSEAILAAQPVWISKAQAYVTANGPALQKMPINTALQTIGAKLGFAALVKVTPAQLNACMVDKVAQKQLVSMTNEAFNERRITGTPSFVINGQLADNTSDWETLEPRLKAAIAAN